MFNVNVTRVASSWQLRKFKVLYLPTLVCALMKCGNCEISCVTYVIMNHITDKTDNRKFRTHRPNSTAPKFVQCLSDAEVWRCHKSWEKLCVEMLETLALLAHVT